MDLKILAKELGLAETATETEVMAAMRSAKTKADTVVANETTHTQALDAEKKKREKAELDFANERKARAGMLIATAITAGKITKAEKPQWETDFANDFSAAETKLGQAKKKVHGPEDAHSKNLGARTVTEVRARQQQQQTFVNEIMDKQKLPYHEAFKAAKNVKPELFVAEKDTAEE